jgi:hypothetical protein
MLEAVHRGLCVLQAASSGAGTMISRDLQGPCSTLACALLDLMLLMVGKLIMPGGRDGGGGGVGGGGGGGTVSVSIRCRETLA